VPSALEDRRRAIIEALRQGQRDAAARLRADDVAGRVDSLEARLTELQRRVASLETDLLESAWSRPAPARAPVPPIRDEDDTDDEVPRTVVPPVPDVGVAGRMSDDAARALFGH
jgi:hypothetical protein